MRESILLLPLALAACAGDAAPGHVVVEDFLDRSESIRCRPADPGIDLAVTELRGVSDTSFMVLDEAQRQVAVFDHDLRLLWRLEYDAAGPGSAQGAVSAAVLGDTAVAIAARDPLRVVILSLSGEPLHSIPLDFIPNSIEPTAEGDLLITPMPLGERPASLLVRYGPAGFEEVGIPLRPYDDMMIRALGNAALVETLPGGDAIVVHQFLAPRGYRVAAHGVVTQIPVPTPDATLGQLTFVPKAPITEDQMLRMLLPGMALSVDDATDHVYLMTRSGRTVRGRPERAILRLDDRMVYLPARQTALVVDDGDRFHACILPSRGATADSP
jgi:hypothetical protein